MRLSVLAACLALPLLLPRAAPAQDCADATTQSALTACARNDFAAADADLNEGYAAAMATMRAIDENLSEDEAGAVAALRAAQRAWITFRDAACAAEGFPMRGGSAEPMLVIACQARLTWTRAEDLWTLAQTY